MTTSTFHNWRRWACTRTRCLNPITGLIPPIPWHAPRSPSPAPLLWHSRAFFLPVRLSSLRYGRFPAQEYSLTVECRSVDFLRAHLMHTVGFSHAAGHRFDFIGITSGFRELLWTLKFGHVRRRSSSSLMTTLPLSFRGLSVVLSAFKVSSFFRGTFDYSCVVSTD